VSWTVGKPLEGTWKERDLYVFLREISTRFKADSFSWNPPNVPANSTVDTTLTTSDDPKLVGLRVGMPITVSPPSTIDAGIVVGPAWVATDDTLTIRLGNATAGAINPVTGTWAYFGMVI